jgi:hypothetical protein
MSDTIWVDMEKHMKKKLLDQAVQLYLISKSNQEEPNKTLPNKAINDKIKKLGSPPWLSQFKVYHAVKKCNANDSLSPQWQIPEEPLCIDQSTIESISRNVPRSIVIPIDDDASTIVTRAMKSNRRLSCKLKCSSYRT